MSFGSFGPLRGRDRSRSGLCVGRPPPLVRGPGESLDRGPQSSHGECWGEGRDHPAICNLLLPWRFAMAAAGGQLPHSVSAAPREGHAGLPFASSYAISRLFMPPLRLMKRIAILQ